MVGSSCDMYGSSSWALRKSSGGGVVGICCQSKYEAPRNSYSGSGPYIGPIGRSEPLYAGLGLPLDPATMETSEPSRSDAGGEMLERGPVWLIMLTGSDIGSSMPEKFSKSPGIYTERCCGRCGEDDNEKWRMSSVGICDEYEASKSGSMSEEFLGTELLNVEG